MRLADVPYSPHFREYAELTDPALLRLADHRLASADPASLAQRVEDPSVPLGERLAAGSVLGLVGDPRLTPVPATRAVDGGDIRRGLPPEEVAAVVARWSHVGVVADWIEKETPDHTVSVPDFWICTYPVTNEQYWKFLTDTGGQSRPTTWYLGAFPWDRSNHPVAGVTAADADAFAEWLSGSTGHPWRLPTEAEWEYAAAGPDRLEFPWGDTFDPALANTRESGLHTTSPVGAFPGGRSPFGVLDLAGNVEEYVQDDYAPYPGGRHVADHLVETMGTYRVARGGSFCRFGDLTRTRRRHGAFPGPLYPVGFRLATSVRP
ncbi:serine/threonine protein kinase [Actinosynnema sp. ALI-1.44]|uniref:formylglycine-generating enzyme family protein n=1 Tax=Actinosynnema sp. ALI-1.44 TaxID=1933779 RepID=UPI00097C02FC|nr:SUMF1/EgtB/PvdO family nonheme iron enzyme [Actinosynnema sp. ALI-1.44]ONI77934.1 serine/threonine protein kinase [Actinosynnema sp. ALI-1.44]